MLKIPDLTNMHTCICCRHELGSQGMACFDHVPCIKAAPQLCLSPVCTPLEQLCGVTFPHAPRYLHQAIAHQQDPH